MTDNTNYNNNQNPAYYQQFNDSAPQPNVYYQQPNQVGVQQYPQYQQNYQQQPNSGPYYQQPQGVYYGNPYMSPSEQPQNINTSPYNENLAVSHSFYNFCYGFFHFVALWEAFGFGWLAVIDLQLVITYGFQAGFLLEFGHLILMIVACIFAQTLINGLKARTAQPFTRGTNVFAFFAVIEFLLFLFTLLQGYANIYTILWVFIPAILFTIVSILSARLRKALNNSQNSMSLQPLQA